MNTTILVFNFSTMAPYCRNRMALAIVADANIGRIAVFSTCSLMVQTGIVESLGDC